MMLKELQQLDSYLLECHQSNNISYLTRLSSFRLKSTGEDTQVLAWLNLVHAYRFADMPENGSERTYDLLGQYLSRAKSL